AEQKIRKGEPQYMVDFFVGLQIHCGAVTALHGDKEFGINEIKSYEGVLSECILTERVELLTQPALIGDSLSSDTTPVPGFVGQIEESNEDNNAGYIILIVKSWGTRISDFLHSLSEWGIQDQVEKWIREFLKEYIGYGAASLTVKVGGVIFTLIITAPPVGGSWVECVVDCMTQDPSGIFMEIFEDKETVETIEAGTQIGEDCEREGYRGVYDDPMQIVYTIMLAIEIYKSPDNHYFYYMMDNLGGKWVVEVEILGHAGCGRVVRAYRVNCGPYACSGHSDLTILEKWVLCDNFVRVWSRSQSSAVWI
ncbi:MAG: hypothetical protein HXS44_06940, partial [Theionarchaea archaeon]|nr:hypothetical protein [Theionarchaea archaeon]